MDKWKTAFLSASLLACLFAAKAGGDKPDTNVEVLRVPLDSLNGLEMQTIREDGVAPVKATAEVAAYRGRRALRVITDVGFKVDGEPAGGQALAILKTSDFEDGTIEADVIGLRREGAAPDVRGFVGIAFHVQGHGSRYESIYLRVTNARADDQLRRNHSTQYISQPDFTWQRLRKDSPGVYESYVDLEPGAWTRIRIEVTGAKAALYVNGADQPCLVVNGLKLGKTHGQIALWAGSDTDAYFANLTVSRTAPPSQ